MDKSVCNGLMLASVMQTQLGCLQTVLSLAESVQEVHYIFCYDDNTYIHFNLSCIQPLIRLQQNIDESFKD